MLRVLIVDDSPTAREILARILERDPEIDVVGVAQDGREAVRLARSLRPDLVTMDIEMPVMNGFEATREIMATAPVPIVIVSVSTRVADAENAMRALQAGALTIIAKPMGPGSASFAADAKQLIETVKTMAGVTVIRRRPSLTAAPESGLALPSRGAVGVVAIAASAGGPPALQTVLASLPRDFPAPIVIVQHLAPGFTAGLIAWLDAMVPLHVKAAESGELMQPGTVYVAPEGRHLGVGRHGGLLLANDDPIGGFRPSATYLFRSVAANFGQTALAVILTGMGQDGVAGLRDVRNAGGQVLAQDEESCVVYGMPGAAVEANLVDRILPLGRIAAELCTRSRC